MTINDSFSFLAPPPPKPKVAMGMTMNANFSELGLDNPTKKEEFKEDFANAMKAKLGGNDVTVTDVRAGTCIWYWEGMMSE